MHDQVFYIASIWMAIMISVAVIVVIRAPSALVRVLALDMVTLLLVSMLVLYSDSRRVPYYLDAALVLALLSAASTIAAARYHSHGQIFDS
jgi:multisubunit Na+/H+ antiporter MnhF subunit